MGGGKKPCVLSFKATIQQRLPPLNNENIVIFQNIL
jgi:hypothetical protein